MKPSTFRSAGVRRIAPTVYQVAADDEPALADVLAAHLTTMPEDLLVDGLTALQVHGVGLGPREPLRLCSPKGHDVRRQGVRVRRLSHTPPLGDDHFFVARPDLSYLVYRLLLEYEGDQHRTDRNQWQRDIERERQLRGMGYEFLRVTAATLGRPRQLVTDVHRLLVKGGYDGPAPRFPPEWLAHFVARPSGKPGRASAS